MYYVPTYTFKQINYTPYCTLQYYMHTNFIIVSKLWNSNAR